VHVDAFDYELPPGAIAQRPVEPRDAARLLVDRGADRPIEHRRVRDLPDLLAPGDVLVVNSTRVLPARLALRKATGGRVEVLLLGPVPGGWEALVRPGRRVPPGTVLRPSGDEPLGAADGLEVEVGDELGEGRRVVRLSGVADELAAVHAVGELPLPPYIEAPLEDPERYQTVYARRPASAAAPTAGLHLTEGVLDRCRTRGIDVVEVELEVGLGTFRPIAVDDVEQHRMHAERYVVPEATWAACRRASRVVAVGTTVVRALESAAASGRLAGTTELFLVPGSPFAVVDVLMTNFHLPRSSLLVLVEAFAGPRWRHLYVEAQAEGYRFLSFGDAMLLERSAPRTGTERAA
jgi:S-adenosylmethionine:tRNA ribosyltransferase-isomerase